MGIKIKHKDPKSTDFSPSDIVVNIKDGTLFYKSTTGLFKVQGDNVNTTNREDQEDLSTYALIANVVANSATASFAITSSNVLFGDITASGEISASGDILTSGDITAGHNGITLQGSTKDIIGVTDLWLASTINHTSDGHTQIDFNPDQIELYASGNVGIDIQPHLVDIKRNLTASYNISCSNDTSTITAATGSFNTMAKQIVIIPFNYYCSSNLTDEIYIPVKGYLDNMSDYYYHRYLTPFNGILKKITIGFDGSSAQGNVTVRFRKDAGGDFDLDEAGDIIEGVTINSTVQDTSYDFVFDSSTSTFNKGNLLAFTVQQQNSTTYDAYGSIVLEMNTST